MQTTFNYTPAATIAAPKFKAPAIVKKEATTKIMLFAAILACLALAVNI